MKLKRSAVQYGMVLVFGAAFLGQIVRADEVGGFYLGGSIGRAQIDTNNALYQSQLESQSAPYGSLVFTKAALSKRGTAWWVNTGYMVWPYLGFEASYLHFGELHNQVSGTYTPTGGVSESVYAATLLRSAGPALGMMLRLPLLEGFDINFRLADYYGRTSLTNILVLNTPTAPKETANGSSLLLGVGAAYTFAGHWSAKLDYVRVGHAGNDTTVVKYNVDMLSVGGSYTF